MKHKLTIQDDGDEQIEIFVDGESVGSFNHDDHGWAGMRAAKDLARDIAKKLDIDIEEI